MKPVSTILLNDQLVNVYENDYINVEEASLAFGRNPKRFVGSWIGDVKKDYVGKKLTSLVRLQDFKDKIEKDKKEGFLYYIDMCDYDVITQQPFYYIKVGRTQRLESRLNTYNTGRCFKVFYTRTTQVRDCEAEEKRLFKHIEKYWINDELYLCKAKPLIEERFDELDYLYDYC